MEKVSIDYSVVENYDNSQFSDSDVDTSESVIRQEVKDLRAKVNKNYGVINRITSYNVCYTKLLRLQKNSQQFYPSLHLFGFDLPHLP